VQIYSFCHLGARWEWVVNGMRWPPYFRERDPVPIVQEAGWSSGPVWTCGKNVSPAGIPSAECPAHSDLQLYMYDPI
jgi:hypothetical protein